MTNSCFILLKVVTGNAAVSQEFKVIVSKCWGNKSSNEKVNKHITQKCKGKDLKNKPRNRS